jgi:hypothetical protein
MKTSQFLREKNRILRETIGLDFDLVPEEQIVDLPEHLMKPLSNASSSQSCPYCVGYFNYSDEYNTCGMCPMNLAGNKCSYNGFHDNTWKRYMQHCLFNNTYMHTDQESPAFRRMKALIKTYNEEL